MPHAVYIHIPFCEQICHYCDFNKVFLENQPVDDYLNALEQEIKHTLKQYPTDHIKTIFVGGGTPTALSEEHLEKFLQMISTHILPKSVEDVEYTFEANPNANIFNKLKILKQGSVNRLSFGVQTFHEHLLKKIGRTHRKEDVIQAINSAKDIGFSNISVDLMFGLPGQTPDIFAETLETAFSLGVQHFSSYSLQVEPKTVFYNLSRKGKLILPTEEDDALMFEMLMKEMPKHGYEQYEISNFAKIGYESQHNLTYWKNDEYYGFGAGAHSYVGGKRNMNAGPLKKYIQLVEKNGLPYIDQQILTKSEQMEEEMFLGLRKLEGVSKEKFQKRYGVSIHDVFQTQITELIQKGLLKEDNYFISLSQKGLFLGNEVFQQFIQDC